MSRLRAAAVALTLGTSFVATAADVTRVASSFEDDDPFGLFIDVGLEHSERRTKILREVLPGPANPSGTRQLIPEMRSSLYDTRVNIDVAAGISRDVEFSVGLPIILLRNEYWGYEEGRGSGTSSVYGRDSDNLFVLPSRAFRNGLGNARFGLAWAVFNQKKDDTKPTWVVRLDYEAPTAKVLDPTEGLRYQGKDDTAFSNVGDRVHKYTLSTALSRQIGAAEPYFKMAWTLPVRGPGAYSNCQHPEKLQDPANCGSADWPRSETGIDPSHVVSLMFGSEFQLSEQRQRRFKLDVRSLANYVSAGRYYNELSGVLGKLLTTGDYLQVGGQLGLTGEVNQVLSVRGTAMFLYNTDHALTDEKPDGDSNGDGTVTANPNYDPRTDSPSRRFYASQSKDLRFNVTATFKF